MGYTEKLILQQRGLQGGLRSKKQQALKRVGTAEFHYEGHSGIARSSAKDGEAERDHPVRDGHLQTPERISQEYIYYQLTF